MWANSQPLSRELVKNDYYYPNSDHEREANGNFKALGVLNIKMNFHFVSFWGWRNKMKKYERFNIFLFCNKISQKFPSLIYYSARIRPKLLISWWKTIHHQPGMQQTMLKRFLWIIARYWKWKRENYWELKLVNFLLKNARCMHAHKNSNFSLIANDLISHPSDFDCKQFSHKMLLNIFA